LRDSREATVNRAENPMPNLFASAASSAHHLTREVQMRFIVLSAVN
jgi:hypothetical protein